MKKLHGKKLGGVLKIIFVIIVMKIFPRFRINSKKRFISGKLTGFNYVNSQNQALTFHWELFLKLLTS